MASSAGYCLFYRRYFGSRVSEVRILSFPKIASYDSLYRAAKALVFGTDGEVPLGASLKVTVRCRYDPNRLEDLDFYRDRMPYDSFTEDLWWVEAKGLCMPSAKEDEGEGGGRGGAGEAHHSDLPIPGGGNQNAEGWFRELPTGVLDPISPEQRMQCKTVEDCQGLVWRLPHSEAALLSLAIHLMADVPQMEHVNKMGSCHIPLPFDPNKKQMPDPMTILTYAEQVMKAIRPLRHTEDSAVGQASMLHCESYDEDEQQSPELHAEDATKSNEEPEPLFTAGEPDPDSASECLQADNVIERTLRDTEDSAVGQAFMFHCESYDEDEHQSPELYAEGATESNEDPESLFTSGEPEPDSASECHQADNISIEEHVSSSNSCEEYYSDESASRGTGTPIRPHTVTYPTEQLASDPMTDIEENMQGSRTRRQSSNSNQMNYTKKTDEQQSDDSSYRSP